MYKVYKIDGTKERIGRFNVKPEVSHTKENLWLILEGLRAVGVELDKTKYSYRMNDKLCEFYAENLPTYLCCKAKGEV
jgi:hypothetical protein